MESQSSGPLYFWEHRPDHLSNLNIASQWPSMSRSEPGLVAKQFTPSRFRSERDNSRPNPYSMNEMNRDLMPESKLEPMIKRMFLSPYDAGQIQLSEKQLSATTDLLDKSIEDIVYGCKWQVGGNKFLTGKSATPLETIKHLGNGAAGSVDEVRNAFPSTIADTFARKQIHISHMPKKRKAELDTVQQEIDSLKRIIHPHVVKVIGSYQEETKRALYAYILTYPVGRSLKDFIESFRETDEEDRVQGSLQRLRLRKWFSCLASALESMHLNHVQHKDIKPSNIIHVNEHIYFTDFSSSRNFESGRTSTDRVAVDTRLFRSPESHNRLRHANELDVYALGLVFVEMLTVLMGRTTEELHAAMEGINGFAEDCPPEYWRIVPELDDWFANGEAKPMYLYCVKPMLDEERKNRPSAAEVKATILAKQPWEKTLACPCKDQDKRDET